MSTPRRLVCAAFALSALVSLAAAGPDDDEAALVRGTWRRSWFSSSRVELRRTGPGRWEGEARVPGRAEPARLTLLYAPPETEGAPGRFRLEVRRRVQATGITGQLDGTTGLPNPAWGPPVTATLSRRGGRLRGLGVTLDDPVPRPRPLPVVRVLLTGFDRFPLLRNHPGRGSGPDWQPATNPSSWAVAHFDPSTLDPALRARCRVEVHRLTDVPVEYVVGARRITDEIARVGADVAISFGVGADAGADVDVERTCTNRMDDSDVEGDGPGPVRLPAAWPPQGSSWDWPAADRDWLRRFPDNAGVSYNGAPIDCAPGAPETLASLLPVDRIVARARALGLHAIDGGSGPGEYICNNTMYRVVQTQAARGRLGGFVHLAAWDEDDTRPYLRAVQAAVEESVRAFLNAAAD